MAIHNDMVHIARCNDELMRKEDKMKDYNDVLRRNLRGYRIKSGFTQKDVSDLLKVTRATIVNWENNPIDISMGKLIQLANLYGCIPDDFIVE